jgi:hypothetical protein
MCLRFSVLVLFCVGSGLATGLSPSKMSCQPSVSFIISAIILNGNRPESLIRQGRRSHTLQGVWEIFLCNGAWQRRLARRLMCLLIAERHNRKWKEATDFLWQSTLMKGEIKIWVNSLQGTAWASNTVTMQFTLLQGLQMEDTDNLLLRRESRNAVQS